MDFVQSTDAPAAIGPYAQAVRHAGLVFCSGQLPLDPGTLQIRGDNAADQTRLVLQNLAAVLQAAGAGLPSVLKTTVYLKDMSDFAAMNGVYAECFGSHTPARATVQVARLPKDALVEIECVAVCAR